MRFNTVNPNFADDVAGGMMSLPIATLIGIEMGHIAPGAVDLELPFRQELSAGGVFLGGIIGALADFAAGCAAATLLPSGAANMTLDYTIKLLAPARGERLIAEGRVVQPGKTVSVVKSDVYVARGESRALCATALVSMRNIFKAEGDRA